VLAYIILYIRISAREINTHEMQLQYARYICICFDKFHTAQTVHETTINIINIGRLPIYTREYDDSRVPTCRRAVVDLGYFYGRCLS